MTYTIKQVAIMADLSVRTLHYYDEIGLLQPSFSKSNGYRYYEEKELLRLQQILFFRELEFPLEKIKAIMDSPEYNQLEALQDQKRLLEAKQKRLEGVVATIEQTITSLKGGGTMKNDDLYGGFSKQQLEDLKKEAEERWGHTDAWKQSQERTKHWTKADYERVGKEGEQLTQQIADVKVKGFAPESDEAQQLIAKHYDNLRMFYEPNYEMYVGLGQMYVDDSRFTAYYEKFAPGLAVFMRDAMVSYADKHKK